VSSGCNLMRSPGCKNERGTQHGASRKRPCVRASSRVTVAATPSVRVVSSCVVVGAVDVEEPESTVKAAMNSSMAEFIGMCARNPALTSPIGVGVCQMPAARPDQCIRLPHPLTASFCTASVDPPSAEPREERVPISAAISASRSPFGRALRTRRGDQMRAHL